MRRRDLAAGAFAAFAAATAVFARRRRRQQVELHYGDGSMVTLDRGSARADLLFAAAGQALAAGRGDR